ncbi:MAG: SOS response-associated peptidase [Armatimonadetes bacterium]|nr:SOS response-associated peptidase [Anaerolineae bacterium]
MCGRFTLTADPALVQQTFNLDVAPAQFAPRYNIAPSQPVAVISNQNPHQLDYFKWGLVPSWSKDPAIGNKMINARAETAAEKPSFREALKKRRCLIPASGFYEWAQDGKQPMYLHLPDDPLFAFAGLWETWHSPDGDELRTCTILTGEPNALVSTFHHRMAVILQPEDYDAWLNPDPVKPDEVMPLLRIFPAARMAAYPVGKTVNSPANDSPACIAPLDLSGSGLGQQPNLL